MRPWTLNRWFSRYAVSFVWLIAAVGLVASPAIRRFPVTEVGVHCPTARIQAIVVVDYVRDGSDTWRPVIGSRAPRNGEGGFVQCGCAEKKAAERDAKTESRGLVAELPVPILPNPARVETRWIPEGWKVHRSDAGRLTAAPASPPLRPPIGV